MTSAVQHPLPTLAGPGSDLSPPGFGRVHRTAALSGCGRYRYRLGRRWAPGPLLAFVLLNPSVADAAVDDPTVRRCQGFARAAGFGGIVVANLYAARSTDPTDLAGWVDPVGPDNDRHLAALACQHGPVVVGWGTAADAGRAAAVVQLLGGAEQVWCLGVTRSGQPRHPLYVPAAARLVPLADLLTYSASCLGAAAHDWTPWQNLPAGTLPEPLAQRCCEVCRTSQVTAADCLGRGPGRAA